MVYFGYKVTQALHRRKGNFGSPAIPVVVIGLIGVVLKGYYNQRPTGDAFLLHHILNERTYSPLPLFLWQHAKPPLTPGRTFWELTTDDQHMNLEPLDLCK